MKKKWLINPLKTWFLLGLIGVLSACSSSSIIVSKLKPLKAKQNFTIKWSDHPGSSKNPLLEPVVTEDMIYVATNRGKIVAYKIENGNENWKIDTDVRLTSGIGYGAGDIFVADNKGILYAYDLQGKLQWHVSLGSEMSSAPQSSNDIVVVTTEEGHIYGLSSEDGSQKWLLARNMPSLVLRNATGMTVTRGAAFVGVPGGHLLAIDVNSGNIGWEAAVSIPRGATELERMNDVLGHPSLGEADVCAASYQGKVACLDLPRGNIIWSHDLSAVGPITASTNKVYAVDEKGILYAYYRSSGVLDWKNETLKDRFLSSPVASSDYIVAGDIKGVVHIFSLVDGTEISRLDTDGSAITMQPVAINSNTFFLQTQAGHVYVITAESK
ncbi:outer membrane protein assembly factor BamB precursor [Ferrovum sp. JA12]|uniref:outer membrane protein assembly factor BamB n=1 Tax=Ferrovum sp. JA12 TaxID=1356299 RepID=UPI000702E2F1|nr:outer membrane protein assembly factor BamB [Ferrovum sp. JA12]KRH78849.1 outer membrane protein assembly factor BamB precursor [Ferrovum sp. JA12]